MLEVFHPVTRWFEIYTIYTLFHIWSGLWSLFINSVTSFQLVLLSGMFQDWCPLINLFVLFLFVLWQQQKYDRKQASNDVVFLNGGEGEGWGVFSKPGLHLDRASFFIFSSTRCEGQREDKTQMSSHLAFGHHLSCSVISAFRSVCAVLI